MDTFMKCTRASFRSLWVAALAALMLAGCGGSGGSTAASPSPNPGSDTGTLLVSVTDADGDFVSSYGACPVFNPGAH